MNKADRIAYVILNQRVYLFELAPSQTNIQSKFIITKITVSSLDIDDLGFPHPELDFYELNN